MGYFDPPIENYRFYYQGPQGSDGRESSGFQIKNSLDEPGTPDNVNPTTGSVLTAGGE